METTKAHCNTCGGKRNHEILHKETSSFMDSECNFGEKDTYETLKCLGCEGIKLRYSYENSQGDETVNYFPAAIFRPQPRWFKTLWEELDIDNDFVEPLLKEIYVALQNNQPRLAAMGVRSLIETVMVSEVGDNGTFVKNLLEFEKRGYVSRIQRERIEAILEVGHAAIHRAFAPKPEDVVTLLDLAEHIIETVYLHEGKIKELKTRIPARPPKGKPPAISGSSE